MIKVNDVEIDLEGTKSALVAEYLYLSGILFKELNDYEKDRISNTLNLMINNTNFSEIKDKMIEYNMKSKTKEAFDTLGLKGIHLKD